MLKTLPQIHKQKGLTLVEMLIAMVLGLFVTAVIITVFSTNVRSSTESIKMIRLNQELRGAMRLMTDELKRAGYSFNPGNPAFMNDFNISSTCVRFSYDEVGRVGKTDGAQDPDERFGFKLENNTVKWTRNGGNPNNPPTAPDCSTGTWTSLTTVDAAFITTLDFDISGSLNSNDESGLIALTTNFGISAYDVTITLVGTTDLPHSSAANDPRRTIIETVRIRNDDPKD